jgi:hypothetical protein
MHHQPDSPRHTPPTRVVGRPVRRTAASLLAALGLTIAPSAVWAENATDPSAQIDTSNRANDFGTALLTEPADDRPGPDLTKLVRTQESDCFEFNESAAILLTTLPKDLTDNYEPVLVPGSSPPRTAVAFVDYVCQSVTVDGVTRPGPSLTTMAVVTFQKRHGVPERGGYLLWHGSTNGPLRAVMSQLGVKSVPLTHSSFTVTDLGDGRSAITFEIPALADTPDLALAHSRSAVVTEPPATPVTTRPTTFNYHHVGRLGEMRINYLNSLRPTSRGASTVEVPPTSGVYPYFADLPGGLPLTRPTAAFTRGSWDGAYFLGAVPTAP